MKLDDMVENGVPAPEILSVPAPQVEQSPSFKIPEFLKAKTGPGSIESYLDHPMNFNRSKGMGRVIRGLTGMFNTFDYAAVDIVVGGLELGKPKLDAKPVKPYESIY